MTTPLRPSLRSLIQLPLVAGLLAFGAGCNLSGWYLVVSGQGIASSCQLIFNNGTSSSNSTLGQGSTLTISGEDGVAVVSVSGVTPAITESYDETFVGSQDTFDVMEDSSGDTLQIVVSGAEDCDSI